MAHPIPDWKFFSDNFFPPKLAVFGGSRHFPKIEGPFPKIEGPGFTCSLLLFITGIITDSSITHGPPTTRALNFWKRTLNFWNLTGSAP